MVIARVDEGLVLKRLAFVARGDRKGYWLESVGEHSADPIQLDGQYDRRLIGVFCGLIRKA